MLESGQNNVAIVNADSNAPVLQTGIKVLLNYQTTGILCVQRGRGRPRGSTKKVKGAPTLKDPNAPRRPTTAYLLFCQQNRDKLRAANPDMTFLGITKELGQQWTQLDEEERQVSCTCCLSIYNDATFQRFTLEAEKDRERYVKEFQEYQKSDAYREFMKSKYPGVVCM